MPANKELIAAILHDYLQRFDKSLGQVFKHKTKAVSIEKKCALPHEICVVQKNMLSRKRVRSMDFMKKFSM